MPASPEVLASLRCVRKSYGKVLALDDMNLQLRGGEVLALLGANGAGKSTAVAVMLGLCDADRGEALLLDQSPRAMDARRRCGVMLQSTTLPDTLEVGELLAMSRGYYAQPFSVADCVAMAGLDGLLRRRYGRLSGGQQRRVQFAMAICGRPQVLFLDEPTTGLDIEARQQMWAAIRERAAAGCAVLLTTHYLEEAEALADHVVVMQAGRTLAEGSVEQIRERVLQRRIRCSTQVSEHGIATWPGVRRVLRDGKLLEIQAEPVEPVVARLLSEDPLLSALEVHRAGLADAFLEITRTAEAA
ncbi:MAG: ABC transporter ATP-binding protein [Pseudoxanthomonas sp.]